MQNQLQKSVVQCMTSPATGWVVLGLTVVFWALHGGYIRIGPPTERPRRFAQMLPSEDQQTEFKKMQGAQGDDGVDWSQPQISVYSVPVPKPSSPGPTLRDLTATGQAHAIDFLGSSTLAQPHRWTDLKAALVDLPRENDPFQFDRMLVATVTKGTEWLPGDRMMWRILIKPKNFYFSGYTIAATRNQTIKIASVETTDTRKLSGSLDFAPVGAQGPKVNADLGDESSSKTNVDVNSQF